MKDNKRVKVLVSDTKNYDKNSEIQEVIDISMIEVCAAESVTPEQIFIYFVFSLLLSLS